MENVRKQKGLEICEQVAKKWKENVSNIFPGILSLRRKIIMKARETKSIHTLSGINIPLDDDNISDSSIWDISLQSSGNYLVPSLYFQFSSLMKMH
jgi:hypothetical protein